MLTYDDARAPTATCSDILASRPLTLAERLPIYATLLGSLRHEESEENLHCMALIDDVATAFSLRRPTVSFAPSSQSIFSPEVQREILELRSKNVFIDNQSCDFVTSLLTSVKSRDEAYEKRLSSWGLYLWSLIEGMRDSVSNFGSDHQDFPQITRSLKSFQAWVCPTISVSLPSQIEHLPVKLRNPGDFTDDVEAIQHLGSYSWEEAHSTGPKHLWEKAYVYGQMLAQRTQERLPESANFANTRYHRVLKTLTVIEGVTPEGDGQVCVFLQGDEIVGRLAFYEHKDAAPCDKLVLMEFSVDPPFRRRGIGQVMLRHAMSRGVRKVMREIAGPLEPLMVQHGSRRLDGTVRLANHGWQRVKTHGGK